MTTRERLLAISEALARIEVAVEALKVADTRTHITLGPSHDAAQAVADCYRATRVASEKLRIVLRRLP